MSGLMAVALTPPHIPVFKSSQVFKKIEGRRLLSPLCHFRPRMPIFLLRSPGPCPSLAASSLSANQRWKKGFQIEKGTARIESFFVNSFSGDIQSAETDENETRAEVTRRIRQFGKEGKLAQAVEALARMQAEGLSPDAFAVTALVDCCVRCKDLPLAQRVFDRYFSKGSALEPDDVAFGVLLRAYGRRKPAEWISIQQLMSRMENEYNVKPSTAVYNQLVEICARDNNVEKGIEILNQMEAAQVLPDYFTIEAVKKRKTLRSHFKKVFSHML